MKKESAKAESEKIELGQVEPSTLVTPPAVKSDRFKKKWLWLGVGVLLIAAVPVYRFMLQHGVLFSINSHEECAFIYGALESDPPQCRLPNGRIFAQGLSEEEATNRFGNGDDVDGGPEGTGPLRPRIDINNELTAGLYTPSGEFEQNVSIVAPEDWRTFSSTELGFSFKYPSEWGDVKVHETKANPSGSSYTLTFTKYDDATASFLTSDYQNDFGKDAPPIWGFLSYDDRSNELVDLAVAKTPDYLVCTTLSYDEAWTEAIVKLQKHPGISFGLVNTRGLYPLLYSNNEDYQLNVDLSTLYYSQENTLTLITIANSVKNL